MQKHMHIKPDLQAFVIVHITQAANSALSNAHAGRATIIGDNRVGHHLQQWLWIEIFKNHGKCAFDRRCLVWSDASIRPLVKSAEYQALLWLSLGAKQRRVGKTCRAVNSAAADLGSCAAS
jgi:hypothetical protein